MQFFWQISCGSPTWTIRKTKAAGPECEAVMGSCGRLGCVLKRTMYNGFCSRETIFFPENDTDQTILRTLGRFQPQITASGHHPGRHGANRKLGKNRRGGVKLFGASSEEQRISTENCLNQKIWDFKSDLIFLCLPYSHFNITQLLGSWNFVFVCHNFTRCSLQKIVQ